MLQYAPHTLQKGLNCYCDEYPRDIPATIRGVICIQHPEGPKIKAVITANSHRVPFLAVGNERIVVHLQDDMPRIVNEAEAGGDSSVAINIIDVTYRR